MTERDGVIGLATRRGGIDDGLVVSGEEPGQTVGRERADDETSPRGLQVVRRLEATDVRLVPVDGVG